MLRYGLAEYPVGLVIHVLVGGYSYRAEVVSETESEVYVRRIAENDFHTISKTNTFPCSFQGK